MSQMILDPNYWRQRLENVRKEGLPLHHAIFKLNTSSWEAIEQKHREILAHHIKPTDKVLDVGCGWGRLLTLMPEDWRGCYIGVDVSPDFIALAKERHPNYHFITGDIRKWERSWGLDETIKMDWAVLISIRPMVQRNTGVWSECEAAIRKVARKLLYLEYDPLDEGSVE